MEYEAAWDVGVGKERVRGMFYKSLREEEPTWRERHGRTESSTSLAKMNLFTDSSYSVVAAWLFMQRSFAASSSFFYCSRFSFYATSLSKNDASGRITTRFTPFSCDCGFKYFRIICFITLFTPSFFISSICASDNKQIAGLALCVHDSTTLCIMVNPNSMITWKGKGNAF